MGRVSQHRPSWQDAIVPNDVRTHAAELMDRIQSGPIRTGWHWLGYNFTLGNH